MLMQRLLHLAGIHVVAAADIEVLLAVDDVAVALPRRTRSIPSEHIANLAGDFVNRSARVAI
jgi:hypothetical protein